MSQLTGMPVISVFVTPPPPTGFQLHTIFEVFVITAPSASTSLMSSGSVAVYSAFTLPSTVMVHSSNRLCGISRSRPFTPAPWRMLS